MAYLNDSQMISRSQNGAIELPEEVAKDVVKAVEAQSVVMRLGRKVVMQSKNYSQPMITGLPTANWVSGDTGLKTTTTVQFGEAPLVAEALAALVIVPDEFFDDAMVPIWSEVKPLMAEAFGRALDNAALFGINKPASWGQPIYQHAISAGNYVELGQNKGMVAGTGTLTPTDANWSDLGVDAAMVAMQVSNDGFTPDAFAVANGLQWRFLGSRDAQGGPLFTTLAGENGGLGLYNLPAAESKNGAWKSGVHLIGGDWDKAVVGIRQDITFTVHTDGVIADSNGVVQFSAMQQDAKILRAVFRVGFAVVNPSNAQNSVAAARSPFSVLADNNSVGS